MPDGFWTTGNINKFRDAMEKTISTLNVTGEKLDAILRKHVLQSKSVPSDRTVGRIRNGKTKRPKVENLELLLRSLVAEISHNTHMSDSDRENIKPMIEFFSLFEKYIEDNKGNKDKPTENKSKVRTDDEQKSVLDAWLANLYLPRSASVDAASLFLSKGKKVAHFLTYRFAADSGEIVKSFTVIHRVVDTVPMTIFKNYRDMDESSTRISQGLVLCFKNEVVCFGQSENGSAAKTLMFNKINGMRDTYTGLLTTHDSDEGGIAARFIMKRTTISNHRDAKTKIYNIDQLAEELSEKELNSIRNGIDFSYNSEICNNAGDIITEKRIEKHIDNLLTEENALTINDGEPFNPLEKDQLNYNAALTYK